MSELRKQYHFRPSKNGFYAWDVNKLVRLVESEKSFNLALDDIAEIDELWWFRDVADRPTPRAIAEHFQLCEDADLSWPIILDPEGKLMDGMHRVLKALTMGRSHILAVRLTEMPEPDFADIHPDDLDYSSNR